MEFHSQKRATSNMACTGDQNVAPTGPSRRNVLKLLATTAILPAHPDTIFAAEPASLRLVFEVGAA